jgi:hypothetical protein
MRWARHVACTGKRRVGYRVYGFMWGSLRERDNLETIDIVGRITLRWVFKKWDGETWSGLIWLRVGHL